jgi:heme/copper-type cytochrome/quinol oxidase subunit 4
MNNSSFAFWFSISIITCGAIVIIALCIHIFTKNSTLTDDKVLDFASLFIFGLLIAFLLSMGMYYWADNTNTNAGKDIFEGCKAIITPLVSIVIGYYFGKKEK